MESLIAIMTVLIIMLIATLPVVIILMLVVLKTSRDNAEKFRKITHSPA